MQTTFPTTGSNFYKIKGDSYHQATSQDKL